jgi:signal transduction histidine kinase
VLARPDTRDDLESLLSAAVSRLSRASGCPRVAAWMRRADGTPRALAATAEAAGPHAPALELFEAVCAQPHAIDLGAAEVPRAAAGHAARLGFAGGVALGRPDPDGPVLLAGGPQDVPGRVRTSTLSALDAEATRLAAPVEAAQAAARLSLLGDEVQRLDALASLGQLVTEIVHEIRNPLVSVKTFLQLLPDRADDPEFRTQFLEVVGEEVRRIERLLALVLDQAHPGPRSAEPGGTAPGPVLAAVVRLLSHRAQERGVVLRVSADAAAPVPMDRDALHQVVLNLAMNAIDATPPGGCVELLAVAAEGAARIACDDQGPGIPRELRERVFEPFFSTKADRPGGLGLAIARRLVLDSGGTLRVEDRRGGGTRIALAWPTSALGGGGPAKASGSSLP